MEPTQIAIAVGAFAVIGLLLFLVRRAADKSATQRPTSGRERLRDDDEAKDEDANNKGRKRRARRRKAAEPNEADEADEADEAGEAGEDDKAEGLDDRSDRHDEEEDEEDEEEHRRESEQLRKGLSKTRGGFVAKLGRLFSKKHIDVDILDELEQVLFGADIGPKTAARIFEAIKSDLSREDMLNADAIWSKIREQSATILDVKTAPLDFEAHKPFVLLTIGVNGVGKTTTIGKIAAKLANEGKKVLLAAGDTFRAAAVEQLEIWGERASAPVVKAKSGSDPSSVIFDAIKRGIDEGFDVVIADTAGRLHTKVDLMDELRKVGRACNKALEGAPHETFLVLDSTTGQNAIQQAQLFKDAMNITGIVITKLDGTAKGGVILGICDEMNVPVRYIGIGERVEDLREFDAKAFVSALYEDVSTADAA